MLQGALRESALSFSAEVASASRQTVLCSSSVLVQLLSVGAWGEEAHIRVVLALGWRLGKQVSRLDLLHGSLPFTMYRDMYISVSVTKEERRLEGGEKKKE